MFTNATLPSKALLSGSLKAIANVLNIVKKDDCESGSSEMTSNSSSSGRSNSSGGGTSSLGRVISSKAAVTSPHIERGIARSFTSGRTS